MPRLPFLQSTGDGLDRVVKGQEKAFVETIDTPVLSPVKGKHSLIGAEPVIVVSGNTTTVAYPICYLIWHGIVNDVLDGQPIAVTFDPIAGSARVYSRVVGGRTLTFGNSGLLRDGDALLFDKETESWWSQLTGEAITGDYAGASLEPVITGDFAGTSLEPVLSTVSSWSEFARAYPQAEVMEFGTAAPEISYGTNPYLGYDVSKGKPIFTLSAPDPRLAPMRRVAVVEVDGTRVAVPFPENPGKQDSVATLGIGGQQVALFYDPLVVSALDTRMLQDSRNVGAFAAYVASYQGEATDFVVTNEGLVDQRSSTIWNFFGRGVNNVGKIVQLQPVSVQEGFWFVVAAAYPGIEIRQ